MQPDAWQKSRRSSAKGQCVEVGVMPSGVAVRDSKDPDGPILAFTRGAWAEFLRALISGEVPG